MFSGKQTVFQSKREEDWYRCSIKMKKFLTEMHKQFGSRLVSIQFKGVTDNGRQEDKSHT